MKKKNLLKFAESHEFDYFLTKAEDARGVINYLWDLLIFQSQAAWETIRGQYATQNEICSCQINHLEIFPCPFTSIFCQEKSFSEQSRHRGWGAMLRVCQEGSPEMPISLAENTMVWETGGPILPATYSVGSGSGHPSLWAWLGFFLT